MFRLLWPAAAWMLLGFLLALPFGALSIWMLSGWRRHQSHPLILLPATVFLGVATAVVGLSLYLFAATAVREFHEAALGGRIGVDLAAEGGVYRYYKSVLEVQRPTRNEARRFIRGDSARFDCGSDGDLLTFYAEDPTEGERVLVAYRNDTVAWVARADPSSLGGRRCTRL